MNINDALEHWEHEEVKPKFLRVKTIRFLEAVKMHLAWREPSDQDWEKIAGDPLMDNAIGFLGEEGNRTLVIDDTPKVS